MPETCPTPSAPQNAGLYWSSQSLGLCSFEISEASDSARYTIEDISSKAVIAKGITGKRSISFASFATHEYLCTITALSACGAESIPVQIQSGVVVRPTPSLSLSPTVRFSTPSAGVTKAATSSPSLHPSSRPVPLISLTPVLSVPVSTSRSPIFLAAGGVTFLIILLIAVVFFIKRRRGDGGFPKSTNTHLVDANDASGEYYVKPYKLEDDGKSMWLILTQGENQILGLYNSTNAVEGYCRIKGIYEEADGVKFVEIASLTPAAMPANS